MTSIKLRPVVTGDDMVLAVEGGYVRRPVPADGVVVETGESEIFLPAEKLDEALRQLDRRRELTADRKAPQRAEQLSLVEEKKRLLG